MAGVRVAGVSTRFAQAPTPVSVAPTAESIALPRFVAAVPGIWEVMPTVPMPFEPAGTAPVMPTVPVMVAVPVMGIPVAAIWRRAALIEVVAEAASPVAPRMVLTAARVVSVAGAAMIFARIAARVVCVPRRARAPSMPSRKAASSL